MRQMQQNGEEQMVSAPPSGDASQCASEKMTPAPSSQPRSSQKFSRRALRRNPVRMQQPYAVQMASKALSVDNLIRAKYYLRMR